MVNMKLTKIQEKIVNKEVEKVLKHRLYEKTKQAGVRFKKEFKKNTLVAISAALGFLIALSWRTPIQNSVNSLISVLNLSKNAILYEFISAIIVTVVAVLILMLVARWSAEKDS